MKQVMNPYLPLDTYIPDGEPHVFDDRVYVFGSHKTTYSRQGCAEKIHFESDGSIPQEEMTSCGMNQDSFTAQGKYPAVIACNLTNGNMPHTPPDGCKGDIPYITHKGEERFISDIMNGTLIGYKYFSFSGRFCLELCVRGEASGEFEVYAGEELVGRIAITPSNQWKNFSESLDINGIKPLYLKYLGEGRVEFLSFNLIP